MLSLKVDQQRLSHKRELALLYAAQEHDDQSARDELIFSHTAFLRWMCKKYCVGKDPDDFFGDAVIGFCLAIDKTDRTSPYRLVTYSYKFVRKQIIRSEFHNHGEYIGQTYKTRESLYKLDTARVKLQREQKQVTIETLSEQTAFSFDKVAKLLQFESEVSQSLSLDAEVGETGDTFAGMIGDGTSTDAYEKINIKVDVDYFLSHLSERERYVVERRFGIPIQLNNVQISKNLGVSSCFVSRLYTKAMQKLQRLAQALSGTPEQIQAAIQTPDLVMSGEC